MNPATQPGLIGKLFGFAVMAVILVLGLMFSVVLLAVVLVLGLGTFGYFWWKTRDVRKQMKEQAARTGQTADYGTIIEGEAVIVEDGVQARPMQLIIESKEHQSMPD